MGHQNQTPWDSVFEAEVDCGAQEQTIPLRNFLSRHLPNKWAHLSNLWDGKILAQGNKLPPYFYVFFFFSCRSIPSGLEPGTSHSADVHVPTTPQRYDRPPPTFAGEKPEKLGPKTWQQTSVCASSGTHMYR